MGTIKVIQAGWQSTLQDNGRWGYQQQGVSVGGCMSTYLSRLANILIGNSPDSPVLEMIQSPHQFIFEETEVVCFCGGGLIPELNGQEISLFEPVLVEAGSQLVLQKPAPGFRMYMAINGGFIGSKFLDSYSTSLITGTGGFKGRAIKKNDVLQRGECNEINFNISGLLKDHLFFKIESSAIPYVGNRTLRVIKGAEYDLLTEESKTSFVHQNFKLTNECNRMGYRLNSNALALKEKIEMVSTAVCKGLVQLLPGGQTIALMADCQTVGGYPRIAKIIEVDMIICSQLKPGDEINFEMVSIEEAEQLYLAQEKQLLQVQEKIQQLFS